VNKNCMKTQRKNEEYYLLGYNAVQSVKCQPTFRRNISPPSSGSKNKLSKKAAWKQVASRARLILRPWRWRQYVPPKRRLTFNGLHGSENLKSYIKTHCLRISYERKSQILFSTLHIVNMGTSCHRYNVQEIFRLHMEWFIETKLDTKV
jgi:hypothetical protein